MKLTSQEEYGLRCLLRVGREGTGGSLTIPELARAEGISEPNVAKMMRILRRAGFVTSTRGQSGGYALSRPAEEIGLGQVLATLGGRLYEPAFCDGHSGLERLCTHMMFDEFNPWALWDALERCLKVYAQPAKWRQLQDNGMARDFSWSRSAREYADLYERARAARPTA